MLNALLKYLPLQCLLCQQSLINNQHSSFKYPWCGACHNDLIRQSRCLKCGLATQSLPTQSDPPSCSSCKAEQPIWDNLCCIDKYDYPYDKLIHRFKYQGQHWLGKTFAHLLMREIKNPAPLLISVPMHWRRRISRGFNHSDVLTRHLAKELGVKHQDQLLKRTKATRRQQGLNKQQRTTNLNGAFTINERIFAQTAPKHLAIVDDVVTTGTTITQLCQLLKDHGVKQIDVYCIARSDGKRAMTH